MHAACRGGRDCRLGAGLGEERTLNVLQKFLTLEVSKLSGRLNADARCRGPNGGHTMRGEVQSTRWPEAAGDRGACAACRVGGSTAGLIGSRARGGVHSEHVTHVRDAGGVEAQWLVERRRVLPRVERRAYGVVRGAE